MEKQVPPFIQQPNFQQPVVYEPKKLRWWIPLLIIFLFVVMLIVLTIW